MLPHVLYSPVPSVYSVCDYVPAELVLCRTRDRTRHVGSKAYQRMPVNLMDLGPLDHQFQTCLNHDLSNIGRSSLNRAIGDHGATRGGITTGERAGDRGIMAHLIYVIMAVQLICFRSNDPRFLGAISYKNRCSPLLNLTLG